MFSDEDDAEMFMRICLSVMALSLGAAACRREVPVAERGGNGVIRQTQAGRLDTVHVQLREIGSTMPNEWAKAELNNGMITIRGRYWSPESGFRFQGTVASGGAAEVTFTLTATDCCVAGAGSITAYDYEASVPADSEHIRLRVLHALAKEYANHDTARVTSHVVLDTTIAR